jgi:hypothetical protein
MKAVNLIPVEERRNTSVAGRSGGGAYALLGALVVLIVLASSWAVAGRNVSDKRAQLADTQAEATRVQAAADRLAVFQKFSDLRAKRVDTVTSIARSRFNWARALREVSRTLPAGVSLTAMTGTVTPAADVDGAVSDPLRTALPNPALVLQGCANGQDGVAVLLSDLRRIEGVERVALSSSTKDGGTGGDCSGGRRNRPAFSLTLFFKAPSATLSAAPASGSAATATSGTAGASGTASPTSSTTSSTTSTGASK